MQKINLAVFASTNGTDLQAIMDAKKSGNFGFADLKFVLSDKKNCFALKRAKEAEIKTFFINPKNKTREEFDQECLEICRSEKIDLIILIGYMKIMTNVIIKPFKNKIYNIHPSLIPKYPGMDLDVHRAVLKNKEKESGCTLHVVTEELDNGPIILQEKVKIDDNETIDSLKQKVQKKEKEVILKGIKMFYEKFGDIKVFRAVE